MEKLNSTAKSWISCPYCSTTMLLLTGSGDDIKHLYYPKILTQGEINPSASRLPFKNYTSRKSCCDMVDSLETNINRRLQTGVFEAQCAVCDCTSYFIHAVWLSAPTMDSVDIIDIDKYKKAALYKPNFRALKGEPFNWGLIRYENAVIDGVPFENVTVHFLGGFPSHDAANESVDLFTRRLIDTSIQLNQPANNDDVEGGVGRAPSVLQHPTIRASGGRYNGRERRSNVTPLFNRAVAQGSK